MELSIMLSNLDWFTSSNNFRPLRLVNINFDVISCVYTSVYPPETIIAHHCCVFLIWIVNTFWIWIASLICILIRSCVAAARLFSFSHNTRPVICTLSARSGLLIHLHPHLPHCGNTLCAWHTPHRGTHERVVSRAPLSRLYNYAGGMLSSWMKNSHVTRPHQPGFASLCTMQQQQQTLCKPDR